MNARIKDLTTKIQNAKLAELEARNELVSCLYEALDALHAVAKELHNADRNSGLGQQANSLMQKLEAERLSFHKLTQRAPTAIAAE